LIASLPQSLDSNLSVAVERNNRLLAACSLDAVAKPFSSKITEWLFPQNWPASYFSTASGYFKGPGKYLSSVPW
jgi:hypothetical protein